MGVRRRARIRRPHRRAPRHNSIKLGVNFLSMNGSECAGHVGENDTTSFILLSRTRQEFKIPFIASRGFADGQELAAALALGAEGVNMGTRFMCTVKLPIHHRIKERIIAADEHQTALVLRRWRNTPRLFRNKIAEDTLKVEKESRTGEFSEVASFASGNCGRELSLNGEDAEHGVYPLNLLFMDRELTDARFRLLVRLLG